MRESQKWTQTGGLQYSITKRPDFNPERAVKHFTAVANKAKAKWDRERREIKRAYNRKEITPGELEKRERRAYNNLHDGYMAGANDCGYSYTLERVR